MATTIRPSPVPTPPASSPPTPPTNYPSFPRLSSPSIQRNASTSSSRSTTTVSSTSSVQAAPMRPPPIETSTAATSRSQLPSRAESETESERNWAYSPERSTIGGRNWGRNGPRSGRMGITSPSRSPPPILNTVGVTSHRPSTSVSTATASPTTPRQPRHPLIDDPSSVSPQGPLRVTISMDPMDNLNHDHRSVSPPSDPTSPITSRGREGHLTAPSSPTAPPRAPALYGNKQRTLSVDGGNHRPIGNGRRSGSVDRQSERDRERRQSQVSNHSHSGSGQIKKPSIRDFVLGEELGQGSYSTVFAATAAASSSSNQSPTSAKLPRKYAIKIINQHHLVQEKKVKYAMIERDALVRLSTPRTTNSPTTRSHRRGLSSSSSGGYPGAPTPQTASKRKSVASIGGSSSTGMGASTSSLRKDSGATIVPNSKDRLSIVTTDSNGSSSPILGGTPLSPVTKNFAGRRPSRSAEPPESVPEQTEVLSPEDSTKISNGPGKSRPPSPVTEEPSSDHMSTPPQPSVPRVDYPSSPTPGYATPEVQGSPMLGGGEPPHPRSSKDGRTPKKRRQSLAPSERSVKSSSGRTGQAHPGVIRLHSTFNDSTSLYFVLDMASNGELATFIRKHGSLDLNSARYYAAQLVDTIEFMHEKGVVHRDLKPENILLDDDMRIKITDFGSAKLVNKEEEVLEDGKKRSFVGSADFVSPEVLRNEPASAASDIWAFGCILYQFLVGKPPFRGATDYLTFQKILKKEMEFPEGFGEDAKALVDLALNLDPTLRPSVQDIKSHPFFALTDFLTIWTVPAPPITTGLTKPVTTLANIDPSSDLWAVFDDEVSDGGFEYDRDEESGDEHNQVQQEEEISNDHSREPRFDRHAAAHAVRNVDNPDSSVVHSPWEGPHVDLAEELGPPRPAYALEESQDRDQRKSRGWSHGSSSSGGNRTALSGWLEAMRIGGSGHGHGQAHGHGHVHGNGTRSSRTSRTSVRSDEYRVMMSSQSSMPSQSATPPPSVPIPPRLSGDLMLQKKASGGSENDKWSSLLLSNERIIFTSFILARTTSPSLHLPSFLLPASKRRQLILTDFPRLITVKDDSHIPVHGTPAPSTSTSTATATADDESPSPSTTHAGVNVNTTSGSLRVKGECVFVVRPSGATAFSGHSGDGGHGAGSGGIANKVTDVQEKGGKGFIVQTAGTTYLYTAESAELRDRWLNTIRRVTGMGA
ncbi:hypothetical protein IAT40_005743 [Kwoniella sp. CBS 6097]